ncbi:MAG: indolepyruvate oxidoreductase subunit beta [Bacillota bacterium]|nr:indolepyruvate oxidoreductase subunit beta [Bacillota bacterium]
MSEVKNILIAGVGGQGTVLAARILSRLLISKGYDIKVSEIHGMSQRGGSVVTQVRFGEKVYSPIIAPGTADYILAFEKLEAVRALPYLKKGGHVIVNEMEINPMPVTMGTMEYPTDLEAYLKSIEADVTLFPAYAMAQAVGNPKSLNMVLLGAWAKAFGLAEEECIKVMEENIPAKFLEVNKKGFRKGYEAVK